MKYLYIISFIVIIVLNSCNVNKKIIRNKNIYGRSLDANQAPNNELKLIYNSKDTIPTTFIINKKIVEKSKVKLVLDTLQMQNYIINVNKENRTIELISK